MIAASPGRLFVVPNTLDFGASGGPVALDELLPLGVVRTAAALAHWICENAKTTRAFLKRVDAVCPLATPLQSIAIVELPRPAKGRADDMTKGRVATPPTDVAALLAPARGGHDLGLLSEAGLPGVADPGAALVTAAHAAGIAVVALPGASALSLAIAASGLDGQSFAFVGYVPVPPDVRSARLRELEGTSRRLGQTQVLIETPYRNQAVLDALLAALQPTTRLAVSVGLTWPAGFNRSDTVAAWRSRPTALPADVPAVFSLLAR